MTKDQNTANENGGDLVCHTQWKTEMVGVEFTGMKGVHWEEEEVHYRIKEVQMQLDCVSRDLEAYTAASLTWRRRILARKQDMTVGEEEITYHPHLLHLAWTKHWDARDRCDPAHFVELHRVFSLLLDCTLRRSGSLRVLAATRRADDFCKSLAAQRRSLLAQLSSLRLLASSFTHRTA